MAKPEFVMPSSEADIKAIQSAVKEASNAFFRIAAERDLVKEIAKRMKDEHALPPADFNKMVRVYFKSEFQKMTAKNESFNEMYESIMSGVDPDLNV